MPERTQRIHAITETLNHISDVRGEVLSNFNIGVWSWDTDDNKIYWDSSMRGIYGYKSLKQPEYKDWASKVHKDDISKCKKEIESCVKTGEKKSYLFRVLYNGQWRYVIGCCDKVEINKIVGVNIMLEPNFCEKHAMGILQSAR